MRKLKIKLESIDDVKNFVRAASQFNSDIDIVSSRYVIDAKSILGLFSLDLSQPVTLRIEDDKEADDIEEAMEEFIVVE